MAAVKEALAKRQPIVAHLRLSFDEDGGLCWFGDNSRCL